MGRFRLEIVVELNAQEFFENRFTVNFQAIFCEVCDLKSVELIREWDEDGVNCKLIRSTPNQVFYFFIFILLFLESKLSIN